MPAAVFFFGHRFNDGSRICRESQPLEFSGISLKKGSWSDQTESLSDFNSSLKSCRFFASELLYPAAAGLDLNSCADENSDEDPATQIREGAEQLSLKEYIANMKVWTGGLAIDILLRN